MVKSLSPSGGPSDSSWEAAESDVHYALDYLTVDDEMDALLDKINQYGYHNLSHYELERLQSISSRKSVRA